MPLSLVKYMQLILHFTFSQQCHEASTWFCIVEVDKDNDMHILKLVRA